MVAVPFDIATVPKKLVPSLNVTEPVGDEPETVAVNLKGVASIGDAGLFVDVSTKVDVYPVDVGTFCKYGEEVAGLKFESPE